MSARPIEALPKFHLHLHLDGSYPRAMVEELARSQGRDLAAPQKFEGPEEFFRRYLEVPALVPSLESLAELCSGVVRAEAEHGCLYLEPSVEPNLFAPRLGSPDEVLGAMVEGFRDGSAATGVEVGAMVGVNTDFPVELAEAASELAERWAGSGVVAFGTAGFVEPAGLVRLRGAVGRARAAGLRIVCHAGQTGGPDSVTEALDELAPDRIAHGVQAARDPAVLSRLADQGVVCDVCLTSNVRLGVVRSYEEHPLPRMLEAGVAVTLNADDELWFGSSIAEEYRVARDVLGLSDRRLAAVALAGTGRSGASAETVRRMVAGVEAWLGPGGPGGQEEGPASSGA